MKRRQFVKTFGLGAAAVAIPGCRSGSPPKKGLTRPNIIFIMSDDHASHAITSYGSAINSTPQIDRLTDGGIRFDNCFCTNGICAPSRAVILTGKYSHVNGVRDNILSFDGSQQTFPKLLQQAGYQTVMIGKWHLKSEPTGFDYWNILPGQGHYYNPDMIEMGVQKTHEGYVTDLITDFALDFLENKRQADKPFMMMMHHKAPHRNWQPAPRHLTMYDDTRFPEPETLFDDYANRSAAASEQEMTLRDHMQLEYDLKMGDPPARLNDSQRAAWEAAYEPKRAEFREKNPQGDDLVRWKYKRYMEDYLGCIAAVDESVGKVLDFLDRTGLAENTIVVYTSDQGFYLGDHGWFDKRFMYEESLRMPLLIRVPGQGIQSGVNGDMINNIDFGPTFLDLAGVDTPEDMQGESFAALLRGESLADWRDAVYYHYYEYPGAHQVKRHYGIRTRRYKLMHFYDDIDAWELFDLERDPQEINSVYEDPNYADVVTELKARLRVLQEKYGDSEELARRFVKEDEESRARRQNSNR